MSMEAKPYQVWHAKDPMFGLEAVLGRYNEWPDDYVHVADVVAVGLEDVFGVTQNSSFDDDVFYLVTQVRSTSVGDVVITPNGEIFRCERFDWSLIGLVI